MQSRLESMNATDSIGGADASQHFQIIDYIIFSCLLSFSAFIGIYYGFVAKRKQNNTAEYILGSRSMGLFPIAVSMIVS